MIKVTRKIHFERRSDRSRRLVVTDDGPPAVASGRVPRVSRLMALAIHFDRLIREGEVRDQSELARLAHVTQPRMTQIMNLNLLAPDIQEELLFLRRIEHGRAQISERKLRSVILERCWDHQRRLWYVDAHSSCRRV